MAGLPSQDIVTNPAVAAQTALMYGAQTQQALRRSQYLADALRQMATEGGQNIRSPGELAAKLLATAIMQRNNNKGQDALIKAMTADQQDETSRMLSPLQDPTTASAPPALPPPATAPSGDQSGGLGAIWRRALGGTPNPQAPMPQAGGPPIAAPAPPGPQPAAPMDPGMSVPPTANPAPLDPGVSVPRADASGPAQPAGYTPQDRDALTQMLAKEAIGEGAPGMTAAAHVALNRLKSGYGGAKSLADVIYQPHQFEGMTRPGNIRPEDYAAAQQIADSVLSGQTPDPTNGAMAFLNPDLQTRLGRGIPNWAQGQGQRIGNHVFFGGQAAPPQGAGGPPAQAPQAPQDPTGPQGQPPPQPYQVASTGPTPPPPSAPGSSPPAVGMPPAAPPPQASAPAGGNPQWPTWKPSPEEYHYVQGLLMDPRTHASGVQEALKMREKMTQKVPAKIIQMNGMSFYVPDEPGEAPTVAIPVPKEAMTQTMAAQDAGLQGAPRGLNVQRDPLGNLKDAPGAPPPGFQVGGNGQLQYQPGGPADPTRPQPAPQGYQYQGVPGQPGAPMTQGAIPGGPADPKAPMNLLQGTQSIQKELRPLVDLAVVARQSMGAVQTGFQQQNGAGDIAMVNGLQHLIDKGVVRGEDVNMQMKSNGLTGSVGSLTQYLQSGGLLTPEIRQRVLKTATDLFGNVDKTYRAQVMGYRQTVDNAYGQGAFDQFVMPAETVKALGWDGNPHPQAPPGPPNAPQLTPGTREAAIAEARRRGLIH